MKYFFALILLFSFTLRTYSVTDSTARPASVLIIPYQPAMHLSDADQDISEGSDLAMPEMRAAFRKGIIRQLNKNFAEVYNVRGVNNDFVKEGNDLDLIYHTLMFESDSVYPLKDPARFAVKDTSVKKKKSPATVDSKYINVGIYDSALLPELTKKYDADYIIFLNELDIKTHYDDCLNLALKIYRRDLKIHYSIFDREGKQIYGDVAVSHFESNANDVNEIIKKNFPAISDYIIGSLKKATN